MLNSCSTATSTTSIVVSRRRVLQVQSWQRKKAIDGLFQQDSSTHLTFLLVQYL